MYNGRHANQRDTIQSAFATHHTTASERLTTRIFVVRPGALGDTLLTFPTLACLRRRAPQARLSVIARADTLPLLRANGLADDAEPWDLPDWATLFADSAREDDLTPLARAILVGADIGIIWDNNQREILTRRLATLGVKQGIIAPALQPADTPQPIHAALWLAAALRPLGMATPSLPTLAAQIAPLRLPAEDDAQAATLWRDLGLLKGDVVALHPGSGSQKKRWPADQFAQVARLAHDAGYMLLLLAGEADTLALAETQAALAQLDLAPVVARGLRVGVLAATLARCAGYIGNDSGVSHLAALAGVPTVAVFGPTDPARWAPIGPRTTAIRAPDHRLASVDVATVWARLRALMAM
ncbi:MAG TPA: glycosyltransferase family 9 protein [Ktedonobacterales bacterium]